MARPKKQIDYEVVRKLASIQCTQEEIANFLELSVRTLQRDEEFCRIYKKEQDNGKMSLRRIQYDIAKKGNASMAIFLGKQYLGQRDVITEQHITPTIDVNIVDNSNLEKALYEKEEE